MRSCNLSLILFGLLVILAVSAVRADAEKNSLEEPEMADARVIRSPDAGRRRKGGKKKSARNTKKARGQRKKASRANRRQRKQKARGTAGLTDYCFTQAVHFMQVWKNIVGNFEKQRKRMAKQNSTGGNKHGKKGLFAPAAHRLVDIGGGNKSNLSCGGQFGNAGAAQLENLTMTLFECEIEVNKSCNPANIPQPNFTLINRCKVEWITHCSLQILLKTP